MSEPPSPILFNPALAHTIQDSPSGSRKSQSAFFFGSQNPQSLVRKSSSGSGLFGSLRKKEADPVLSRIKSLHTPGLPLKTTVFATPLADVIQREHEELTTPIAFFRPIPYLVEECIAYLYPEQQLESEGIFRQSGKAVDIQDVKLFYDKGKYVSLQGFSDPHVVAGIIKLFVRELPDPLIPFSAYPHFIAYQKDCQNEKDPVSKISGLLSLLPKENRALLKLLLLLLKRTSTFEKKNKMSTTNLAIVIGPNILRAKEETMLSAMEESPLINFITTSMIELTPEIWENDKETQHINLEWLLEKRSASLPLLISISAARESLEVQKQAKSKLSTWFQRRPKKEELVQKKILQSFD